MVILVRIRSTKPEFWSSRTIAAVDWDARLVLKGLESYVDDNGVGRDDVALIVAAVFVRDHFAMPRETVGRVSEAISRLTEAGLLWRYRADGKDLLFVSNWDSLQRVDKPQKGRFPRPDGTMNYKDSVIRESVASVPEGVGPVTEEQGNRGTGEQNKELGSSGEPEARASVGGSSSASGRGVSGDGSASVAAGDGGVVGFSAVPGGGDGEAGPDGEKVSGVSGCGGKSGEKSGGNSETGSRKKPVRFNYPDDFNAWWSAYPKTKNKSKKNAFTEWKKAVRSVTAEKLLELTEMYAANPGQDDLRFVPDPERWLKGSRWETVADVDADPAASRPSEDPMDPAAWLGLPSGGWSAPWGEDAPASAPVDALPVLDADVVPEDGWGDSGPSEPAFWVPAAVPAPSDRAERWA